MIRGSRRGRFLVQDRHDKKTEDQDVTTSRGCRARNVDRTRKARDLVKVIAKKSGTLSYVQFCLSRTLQVYRSNFLQTCLIFSYCASLFAFLHIQGERRMIVAVKLPHRVTLPTQQ